MMAHEEKNPNGPARLYIVDDPQCVSTNRCCWNSNLFPRIDNYKHISYKNGKYISLGLTPGTVDKLRNMTKDDKRVVALASSSYLEKYISKDERVKKVYTPLPDDPMFNSNPMPKHDIKYKFTDYYYEFTNNEVIIENIDEDGRLCRVPQKIMYADPLSFQMETEYLDTVETVVIERLEFMSEPSVYIDGNDHSLYGFCEQCSVIQLCDEHKEKYGSLSDDHRYVIASVISTIVSLFNRLNRIIITLSSIYTYTDKRVKLLDILYDVLYIKQLDTKIITCNIFTVHIIDMCERCSKPNGTILLRCMDKDYRCIFHEYSEVALFNIHIPHFTPKAYLCPRCYSSYIFKITSGYKPDTSYLEDIDKDAKQSSILYDVRDINKYVLDYETDLIKEVKSMDVRDEIWNTKEFFNSIVCKRDIKEDMIRVPKNRRANMEYKRFKHLLPPLPKSK